MAKQKSTPKPVPQKTPKLFFLEIPAEHPGMSPDLSYHLGMTAGLLLDQIDHLEIIDQLATIEEGNETVLAMSYGLSAVVKKLHHIHAHFSKTNTLIKSWPAGKGGAE